MTSAKHMAYRPIVVCMMLKNGMPNWNCGLVLSRGSSVLKNRQTGMDLVGYAINAFRA
jgi:hypothetical protein